jgi:hypothetical protein
MTLATLILRTVSCVLCPVSSVFSVVKHLARLAIVMLIAAWLASCAVARERAAAVRFDSGLTVVPFAVPVATPVAVVQPGGVYYAVVPQGAGEDATLRAEFEAFKRWRLSQGATNAAAVDAAASATRPISPSPLLNENCLSCHRGEQAKGGVRFDVALSSEQRLAAMRAVLTGEMPKGKPLAPDVLGELLLEISQSSSVSSVQGE